MYTLEMLGNRVSKIQSVLAVEKSVMKGEGTYQKTQEQTPLESVTNVATIWALNSGRLKNNKDFRMKNQFWCQSLAKL